MIGNSNETIAEFDEIMAKKQNNLNFPSGVDQVLRFLEDDI
jgi:hypothetical protein